MKLSLFSTQLKKAVTEEQATLLLDKYLLSVGFKNYAFTYYSGHIRTGRKLLYDCASTALHAWHVHYLEEGYADIDRTLEEIHATTFPVFWDVPDQLLHAKNKREKRLRQDSIEFGIDKGLSVPIYGPNNDFASLTLHQFRGETSLVDYEKNQFEWISAAYIFYHHIRRIITLAQKTASTPYHLTKREAQCLELTAKLWRVEKIAKELKISPRTVNFHLQNANKKLGTHNKHQAIYKILLNN